MEQAATRELRAGNSDWSEFLQRGADPDNPIQEHVFHVPRPDCGAYADKDAELERIVVRVRAGKAEEEFYETGQVLELGAGLGVPGLLAARQSPRVYLTDHNPIVVELLQSNVDLNRHTLRNQGHAVSVHRLDWADCCPAQPTASSNTPTRAAHSVAAAPCGIETVDVVLGADVVYSTEAVEDLFNAVDAVLSPAPSALFILAYIPRWPAVDQALMDAADSRGFVLNQLLPSAFLPPSLSTEGWLPAGAALYLITRGEARTEWLDACLFSLESHVEAVQDHRDASQGGSVRARLSLQPPQLHSKALERIEDVQELEVIQHGPVTLRARQAQALCEAMPRWASTLTDLHLRSLRLGIGGAEALLQVVWVCCGYLQTLSLQDTTLGAEGATRLAEILKDSAMLRSVNLNNTGIGEEGGAAVLSAVRVAGGCDSTLTSLSLASNSLSFRSPSPKRTPPPPPLAVLDLAFNVISGARAVAACLCHVSDSLVSLTLDGNVLEAEGTEALSDHLRHLSQLRNLSLNACMLGCVEISIGGTSCAQLSSLSLASNAISDEGAKALAEALPEFQNEGLAELKLSRNSIGSAGAVALTKAWMEHSHLQQLDLSDNLLDDEALDLMTQALEHQAPSRWQPDAEPPLHSRRLLLAKSKASHRALEAMASCLRGMGVELQR